MRQFISTLSLAALLAGLPVAAIAQVTEPASRAERDPVEQVIAAGLMSRDSNGNFRADNLLSRAELASVLVKTFQLNRRTPTTQGAIAVRDVPTTHWAYEDIQTVLKTGIMKGYRGDLFYPNQRITRAEAFAIFAQAYGVFQFPDETVSATLARYPDASEIPGWARKAIATALFEGFVNIDPSNSQIRPLQPITRGDLAFALSRYLQRERQEVLTPIIEDEPAALPQ